MLLKNINLYLLYAGSYPAGLEGWYKYIQTDTLTDFYTALVLSEIEVIISSVCLQVGNSVYYNFDLSVNGKREHHGDKYPDDYLTDIIVSSCYFVFIIIM